MRKDHACVTNQFCNITAKTKRCSFDILRIISAFSKSMNGKYIFFRVVCFSDSSSLSLYSLFIRFFSDSCNLHVGSSPHSRWEALGCQVEIYEVLLLGSTLRCPKQQEKGENQRKTDTFSNLLKSNSRSHAEDWLG